METNEEEQRFRLTRVERKTMNFRVIAPKKKGIDNKGTEQRGFLISRNGSNTTRFSQSADQERSKQCTTVDPGFVQTLLAIMDQKSGSNADGVEQSYIPGECNPGENKEYSFERFFLSIQISKKWWLLSILFLCFIIFIVKLQSDDGRYSLNKTPISTDYISSETITYLEGWNNQSFIGFDSMTSSTDRDVYVNQIYASEEVLMYKNIIEETQREVKSLHEQLTKLKYEISDDNSIKEMLEDAIERYNADKTGLYDYALESVGGAVVVKKCSPTIENPWRRHKYFGLFNEGASPRTVIQRRFGPNIDDSWSFNGSSGRFTVRLSEAITVTSVSYEHLPARLCSNKSISFSPWKFQIWGYDQKDELASYRMLGEYLYDVTGRALQSFDVENGISNPVVNVVEFRILSNHGGSLTCLYRLRVHGTPQNESQYQP